MKGLLLKNVLKMLQRKTLPLKIVSVPNEETESDQLSLKELLMRLLSDAQRLYKLCEPLTQR